MRALKAFVLGLLAFGIVAYAVAAAVALAAQAGGHAVEVGIGPLQIVSVTLAGSTTATTFGAGILVIAIVGGLANLAVAELVRHRAATRADRVD